MTYQELTMIDVREVLRRWARGDSGRQIARDTGRDRETVGRYISAAEQLVLPRDRALTDDEIHAAASLTSNGTVGVVGTAVELLARAGLDRSRALHVLLPLLAGTVENLGKLGLPAALTGPVARGDARTIAIHRSALRATAAQDLALYDALADAQKRLPSDR